MEALILTGGQGTRLRPLTLTTLKPLLPIANVSFLNHPLALLRAAGVSQTVLCSSDNMTPYDGLIRRQKLEKMKITCSREKKSLGTAGAVKNAEAFIKNSPFFVLNGDILSDLDFSKMLKFHQQKKAAVTLALVAVEDPSQYGLVLCGNNGRVKKFVEKPSERDISGRGPCLINTGLYIMEKEVLDLIPKNAVYSMERELFPLLLKKGRPVYGYAPSKIYWQDIGTPEKYLSANLDMAAGRVRIKFSSGAIRAVHPTSKIHKTASVGKDVVIGKNCVIEENSVLNNCVLLDRVRVGKGAVIENCILGNSVRIGDFSRVQGARALGDNSIITPFSRL